MRSGHILSCKDGSISEPARVSVAPHNSILYSPVGNTYGPAKVLIDELSNVLDDGVGYWEELRKLTDTLRDTNCNDAYLILSMRKY